MARYRRVLPGLLVPIPRSSIGYSRLIGRAESARWLLPPRSTCEYSVRTWSRKYQGEMAAQCGQYAPALLAKA
jgi:hypothetical protein